RVRDQLEALTSPLEAELRKNGLQLTTIEQGEVKQTTVFPLVDGEPVSPVQFRQLVKEGRVSEERVKQFDEAYPKYRRRLQAVGVESMQLQRDGLQQMQDLHENAARELLAAMTDPVQRRFDTDAVRAFLREVVEDVIDTWLRGSQNAADAAERYGVNIVSEHEPGAPRPVIVEHTPSRGNLLGSVDVKWGRNGPEPSDYSGIRAGSLLRADGGYLVLDVGDVLGEPGAWHALMRTLRSGKLEIVSAEAGWLRPAMQINPEPVSINVRVVLIGDAYTYYQLDRLDADFGDLFKVLADFDNQIPRDEHGIAHYARVISHIVRKDELQPFNAGGVAALAEHGARIASRAGKLTANFGRLADIAREASHVATGDGSDTTTREHVRAAVARTKQRASLPSVKFQELIDNGTIRIDTDGEVVGQINGLAVISSGPITYGFPARITATIGAGRAGLINIEGTASLSGSIHTKGFHILGGLLRYLLKASHPLAFSASVAFEQSYGGIDGDSASGAEMCCLLSALTGVPIRQQYAITGAIDQFGHIQSIGGVNEKVEGFFDVCSRAGLTGDQGVIVPQSNAGDLMLRPDVVEACASGTFSVFAVSTIAEALEILTGMPAGEYGDDGYPEGTLLRRAVDEARSYWQITGKSPAALTRDETDSASEDE
ncbi:MAG: AAA family ATPase, partial [Pseudomonadota bacterium]